jgi:hypothetical protein
MSERQKDPNKQAQLAKYIARARANPTYELDPEVAVPREAISENPSEEDILRAVGQVVLFGVHRWYITRLSFPDETKLTPTGLKCRARWNEYHGNFSHPDIDSIRDDINECMAAATAAALTAGLITGNFAAGVAAFKVSVVACLEIKGIKWASEISIWIDEDQRKGSWRYCL